MNVLLMYEPSAAHLEALKQAAPGANLMAAADEPGAARQIAAAEAVLGNRYFLQSLPHARRLRWMQSGSMGVDRLLREAGLALQGVTLTNARGVYDDEVAEHALALILALLRGIHHARDEQRQGHWNRRRLRTAAGARVLILGWGGVGQGIARRLLALGATVAAARRGQPEYAIDPNLGCGVHGLGTWRQVLPETDILVAALPLTDETRHLVSAAEVSSLPPGALVINIGRGGTLDDEALLQAIRSGHLGGAGLDVLEQEPPAAGHGLWIEPNVLLTPHEGRALEGPPYRWEPLFVENLRRFAGGEPLLNVVEHQRGY